MGIIEDIFLKLELQEKQVSSLISEVRELKSILPVKDDPWLRSSDIKSILKIRYSTFLRILPRLVHFGAVKNGQWKMKKSGLNAYQESLKN